MITVMEDAGQEREKYWLYEPTKIRVRKHPVIVTEKRWSIIFKKIMQNMYHTGKINIAPHGDSKFTGELWRCFVSVKQEVDYSNFPAKPTGNVTFRVLGIKPYEEGDWETLALDHIPEEDSTESALLAKVNKWAATPIEDLMQMYADIKKAKEPEKEECFATPWWHGIIGASPAHIEHTREFLKKKHPEWLS